MSQLDLSNKFNNEDLFFRADAYGAGKIYARSMYGEEIDLTYGGKNMAISMVDIEGTKYSENHCKTMLYMYLSVGDPEEIGFVPIKPSVNDIQDMFKAHSMRSPEKKFKWLWEAKQKIAPDVKDAPEEP
ncbi:MAG: hypothetical protein ACRBB3_10370 [Alphaproteobacteria bacterium]